MLRKNAKNETVATVILASDIEEIRFAYDRHLQTHMCACARGSCLRCLEYQEIIAELEMLQPA
jgi:hypothetical protein